MNLFKAENKSMTINVWISSGYNINVKEIKWMARFCGNERENETKKESIILLY